MSHTADTGTSGDADGDERKAREQERNDEDVPRRKEMRYGDEDAGFTVRDET